LHFGDNKIFQQFFDSQKFRLGNCLLPPSCHGATEYVILAVVLTLMLCWYRCRKSGWHGIQWTSWWCRQSRPGWRGWFDWFHWSSGLHRGHWCIW